MVDEHAACFDQRLKIDEACRNIFDNILFMPFGGFYVCDNYHDLNKFTFYCPRDKSTDTVMFSNDGNCACVYVSRSAPLCTALHRFPMSGWLLPCVHCIHSKNGEHKTGIERVITE